VTFKDGTTILNVATLAGGTASFTISTLRGGIRSITALYSGDSNFSGSASAVLIETVNPVGTSTTVTALPTASQYHQPVTLSATVSSVTGVIPVGHVAFNDGTHTLGTASLIAGNAAFSVSNLSAGVHSITAVYPGAAAFLASTSASITTTVSKASTTTTLMSSPNPSSSGQAVTFTATVLGAYGGSPTASVTFMDGSTILGRVATDAITHQATLVISTLAVGAHYVTATFSGNANFAASTSAVLEQDVAGGQAKPLAARLGNWGN
jgi:hypothetical protein